MGVGGRTAVGRGAWALGALVAAAAFATATSPLYDNSTLTHLATGRLLLDGTIPRADPYTFTAAGEPWVVQSWLVSLVAAGLEELVSLGAVRLLFGALTGLAVALCWLLTAPARTPLLRLAVVVPVVVMAATGWAHRPYLVGYCALAALLLALEGRLRPPALVPVMWVWVNAHGSWPLGLAVVAACWLGAALDRAGTGRERAVARWTAVGLAAGLLNPYGWRILTVPLAALRRPDVFGHILEWQAPRWSSEEQVAFLAVVAAAILLVGRRASWRDALPVAGFVLAALWSARNIGPATIVALPAVSRAVGERWTSGALRVPTRPVVALAAVLAALGAAQVADGEHVDEDPYPTEALAYLEEAGLDPTRARVVAREAVGNWFELRYGTDARVFVDDRFEVVPTQVVEDLVVLLDGGEGWEEALARYEPDAVLWEKDTPLGQLLEASDAWRVVHRDDQFLVAVPAR